jgi:hypothetical protein
LARNRTCAGVSTPRNLAGKGGLPLFDKNACHAAGNGGGRS